MAEQQESNRATQRKSRSDLFLIIGILSILVGFFTFFIPWIWGIPLLIAGLPMRRNKGQKERKTTFFNSNYGNGTSRGHRTNKNQVCFKTSRYRRLGILIENAAGKGDINQDKIINWESRNVKAFS